MAHVLLQAVCIPEHFKGSLLPPWSLRAKGWVLPTWLEGDSASEVYQLPAYCGPPMLARQQGKAEEPDVWLCTGMVLCELSGGDSPCRSGEQSCETSGITSSQT